MGTGFSCATDCCCAHLAPPETLTPHATQANTIQLLIIQVWLVHGRHGFHLQREPHFRFRHVLALQPMYSIVENARTHNINPCRWANGVYWGPPFLHGRRVGGDLQHRELTRHFWPLDRCTTSLTPQNHIQLYSLTTAEASSNRQNRCTVSLYKDTRVTRCILPKMAYGTTGHL